MLGLNFYIYVYVVLINLYLLLFWSIYIIEWWNVIVYKKVIYYIYWIYGEKKFIIFNFNKFNIYRCL